MNTHRVLMWIMVSLIIILSGFNLYLTYKMAATSQSNKSEIQSSKSEILSMNNKIDEIQSKLSPAPESVNETKIISGNDVAGKDGHNGADGRDGIDGKDSISTHTIEKETIVQQETIVKELPDDLLNIINYPSDLRCNTNKNRWEIKYSLSTNWQLMGDSPVKCTLDNVVE